VVPSWATPADERPTWRGWLHTVAFVLAIPMALFLTLSASGTPARTAAGIYGLSLVLAFGSSAAYHRLATTERAQRVLQRVDHSMIFVLIAGTFTPMSVIAMPRRWGIPLLAVVWAVALTGIALKVFGFHRFRNLGYWLYAVIVVAVAVGLPQLWRALTGLQFGLVLVGGLLYIAGVPVLMRGRPNPWPSTFGYHEVWHAFTVAAGACQLCGIVLLVR